eukprot:9470088-Pyramimonas_sp.AAC.1
MPVEVDWDFDLRGIKRWTKTMNSPGVSLADMHQDKLPKSFLCPITGEVFIDPVMTMDGHTYERLAIT